MWTAFWVITIAWLFDGARRLVAEGLRRKVALRLACALVVCAAVGAGFLWMHFSLSGLVATLHTDIYVPLPPGWGAELAPDAKEKASGSYAQAAFLNEGKLVNYFDRSRGWTEWKPTQSQVRERESALAVQIRLEEQARDFRRSAILWWLSACFAILVGLAYGRFAKADG
jgi:hypothetical protein